MKDYSISLEERIGQILTEGFAEAIEVGRSGTDVDTTAIGMAASRMPEIMRAIRVSVVSR